MAKRHRVKAEKAIHLKKGRGKRGKKTSSKTMIKA